MKRIIVIIFVFLSFIACNKEYLPRNIESITIQKFKIDSTSIRAIQIVNENEVIYAGSNGDIGIISDSPKNTLSKISIQYQDSISPNFRSVASNGKAIFALSIGNPALLYKVKNGKIALVYKEVHEKVFYDAMKFFEDNIHGIAVGDPTEDCPSILLTKNAGETWEKVSCDILPKFDDGEAFFAASNTNIKTIGNTVWLASGGKKTRILKSTDYGRTWTIYNTPIVQGNGPQGIYSIDFADKKNGIVMGGNYSKPNANKANKAITKDGGKTWTIVSDGLNPNYKSCVQYVPNTNGKEVFTVGKTGVSFSNDSGNTWTDISKESYYTIQFVDRKTAWLSGNNKIGKLVLE
ncbi:WD40/YVTN/BNR-like repeat-containing protein [Polaribacter aquimarinus]|uniref:Oxidoreductase n=1 Tax=Polaribacter aquimarinus TaxID=2100726 RepID=A0A2U2J804_9FLAO|nr:oxidoreductase [Polaribacter aquimarinus]PWG04432.1 oxidoreductase [Polaribacter aquimarinus]